LARSVYERDRLRRFQMQAAGDGNGDNFVAVRRKNVGKLADAFRIAALSEADKELSTDAQNVAAFQSAGREMIRAFETGERFGE